MLFFENETDRIGHAEYFLPRVEIEYYNVIIDGRNIFDPYFDQRFWSTFLETA